MVKRGELDVSRARFVSLDEWVGLSADAMEDDCTHFMMRYCYGPLNIPAEHMTLFDPCAEDLEAECRKIDQVIFDNGGIDFMMLGLGMNGHLGLNEPGADFHNYSHVMGLSDVTKSVGQKYFSQQTTLSGGITVGIQHMFETGGSADLRQTQAGYCPPAVYYRRDYRLARVCVPGASYGLRGSGRGSRGEDPGSVIN